MNIKRGKSLIALMLVIAMLLTVIPIHNRVMAADTGSVTLEFVEVTASNVFKFTGTLAGGSYLPQGMYMVSATIVHAGGTVTKDIVLDVGSNGAISIWTNFFHWTPGNHSTVPTQSLMIAKNAILTQVQYVSNVWSVVEGGATYTMGTTMRIDKDDDGVWNQVVVSDYNEVELGFDKVDGTSQEGLYYTTSNITDGPNYGTGSTTLSSVYGTWDDAKFSGTVVFRLRDGTKKEVTVTGFNVVGTGIYVNLTLQSPETQVTDIKENVASVTIEAGTIFEDQVSGRTPIKITNTLTLLNMGHDIGYVAISEPNEEILATKSGKANVILLAGQSNATGTSQILKLQEKSDAEDFARYQKGYDNVLIRYEVDINASGTFVPVGLGQGGKPRFFGPEIGIADYLSQAYPDETFYIIKSSWSGTSLGTDWQEDADVYKAFVERTDKSFQMLEDSGLEPQLFAFCWMQGESDATQQAMAEDYYNQLSGLVTRVSTKYSKYIPATGMAFIDAGISNMSDWTYHEEVNSAKQKFAAEQENRYYLDTQAAGLTYDQDNTDYAHYDAIPMVNLGTMFGKAVEKAYNDRIPKVEFTFVSGATGGTFTFTGELADGNYLPGGTSDAPVYYRIPAIIDGATEPWDILMYVGTTGNITIYNDFFQYNNNSKNNPPDVSLKFEEGATLTQVKIENNVWSEVTDGKTYKLSKTIDVINNNEQWIDSAKLEQMTSALLGFVSASDTGVFKLTGTLEDGSYLPGGTGDAIKRYKVPATIVTETESVTKEITLEVEENGAITIHANFFNWVPGANYTIPTKSLTFAKNAVFTEVEFNSGWKVKTDGLNYKLGREISIKKNQFGLWDLDVETTDLGSLTMTLNKVENKNTYLVGTFQNGGTLTNGDYYKGVATIETDSGKETKFITLGIGANNAINIYNGFYTWNNAGNTPPTKSFKIAAGTTFRQVYANPWREVPADETPTSFTVVSDLSLVCIDGTWYAESISGDANGDGVTNVCDLVRYLKYNQDSANTKIATGADINGNNIYDDIDRLKDLLIGKNIAVATYFNLVKNGNSDYTIVTPANATENEQVAANELQYFIKESTGATLSIATETDSLTAGNGKYIYVGNTKAAEEASVTLASSAQKKNGYLIKTVEDDCYLRGYSDIGTKNSVYEFLDHAFDYEFYASDEIYLTKTSNAKLLNYNLETSPDFEWRLAPNGEVIYTANGSFATSTTGVVANRMRFNLASDIFVTKYDFHNGYTILPPATYLEEHPDWYSRDFEDNTITYTSDAGTLPAQLCYSSASMREQFTIELLELLESTTVANVMLGQQDTKYWCECEACSAAKEQYGTNAAVLVQFANAVQADVNTWFVENRPGETPTRMVIFAYQSTSQPAVKWDEQSQTWTAIDEKVILNEDSSVMFAIGDMQMHVPFAETDSSSLSTPYGRILGWEACSDSMFAWTYSLYMNHGLLFSNTIDVMAQNYRLLAEHGVTMIQDQADSYQKYKNSGFSRLETYLMSKMQWDTSLNEEQLIDDFFANYFGEAADTMKTLFNLERKNILAKYEDESIGFKGTFGEDVLTTDFWPQDELEAYQALIQQAYSDIASLEATDAERYARLYERILLESMQFDYIDCSLYNTDISNRNEFKNNFEELGMYSYSEHKSIGSLWKAWGIQYGQIMSYSYTNDANSFNFVLHKGSELGWYQAEAYVDGVLTPVLIEVTGSNSAWIYWHSFNNNNSSNTTKQPTTSLVIRPGTLMKPVVTNSWNQQDMSRPSYKLETQLYITKTENGWVAGDTISAKPTGITMNFEYTSDKNQNGKYDFAFSTNQAITNGWYKADAVIDGKVQSVLLQVMDLSDSSSRVWIYEGCFNDNAKLSDSVLPQSMFVITKGTVLSPVIASKYTVDSERIGYQLTQELNITNTNGKWQ